MNKIELYLITGLVIYLVILVNLKKYLRKVLIYLLNQLTQQTLSKPEVRARLMNGGLEPNPGSPEDLARYIQLESNKWRKIVQQSGVKAE